MSECFNCGRSLDWQDPEACGTGDPMGFGYTTTIECLGHGLERTKAALRVSRLLLAQLLGVVELTECDNCGDAYGEEGGCVECAGVRAAVIDARACAAVQEQAA